jgi:NAD(P)H-nitrite reductase large subunit
VIGPNPPGNKESGTLDREDIICRCVDVTYGEIADAIDSGLTSTEEIKRVLRCGMGPCQGRTCSRLIAGIISERTGRPVSEVRYPNVRPPTRPIEIGTLAERIEVGELSGTGEEE